MTDRLFEQNPYIRAFDARVLECEEKNGTYRIRLDRTAFFPEAAASRGTGDGLTRRSFPIPTKKTGKCGIMPTGRCLSAMRFRDGWIGHFAFPTCRIMPESILCPD